MNLATEIQCISTENMPRPEWLALRANRIGGSDCGSILGLNEYQASIELFYAYVGSEGNMWKKKSSLPMAMGNILEPVAMNLYRAWGGSPESLLENLLDGVVAQDAEPGNCLVVNPKHPHLHASPDGFIKKSWDGREDGILEIKTIAGFSAEKYSAGYPPSYDVQIQQYLLVCEKKWADLAILKDGRTLQVIRIEADPAMQQRIIYESLSFWARVETARDIWADATIADEDKAAFIAEVEPEADTTLAYEKALQARWRSTLAEREGTVEELVLCREISSLGVVLKQIEAEVQGKRNELLKGLNGTDGLGFGGHGKVTYRLDSRGFRRLAIKLKEN